MRESFGGAFMIKLVLIFIVIYVSFMAVAVNYAKAFRVKNNVINILEQNEFQIGDSIDIIDEYLKNVPYDLSKIDSIPSNCNNVTFGNTDKSKDTVLTGRGVCITQLGDKGSHKIYYKVTTYIAIDFPFFGINMTLPISGETKIITHYGGGKKA